jgi:hypothetical protein
MSACKSAEAYISACVQETETIMHFFLPNGFDEDVREAGVRIQQ